jgi:HK97 gp10 family phage protein
MRAKDITQKLINMVNEQKLAVDDILSQGAERMVADVKSNIPTDTGLTASAYKHNIKIAKAVPIINGNNIYHTVGFGNRDNVAFFLEYGTIRMKEKPTIRPAWSRHIHKTKNEAVSAAKKVIEKYNRG